MLISPRFLLITLICLVSPCLLITSVFSEGLPVSEHADIVLMNGTVYTVQYGTDWPDTPQEAIAIHGRTILAVDSNNGIEPYIGPETQVHDLKGEDGLTKIH
jgi:Predicted metal-dependent hydrolase with the TIM-barrel fold